jgi:hypothetical protein
MSRARAAAAGDRQLTTAGVNQPLVCASSKLLPAYGTVPFFFISYDFVFERIKNKCI